MRRATAHRARGEVLLVVKQSGYEASGVPAHQDLIKKNRDPARTRQIFRKTPHLRTSRGLVQTVAETHICPVA